jgi:hypothetical protein
MIEFEKGIDNYRIFEIERHLHSYESWFGDAITAVSGTHEADRIGVGVNAFQIDAGNNTWGSWLQILGSSDTPARTGNLYFDLHRVQIVAAERTAEYFIQIAKGDSGAAGLSAEDYTETVFKPSTVQGKPAPIDINIRRFAAGSKVWARCMCLGQDTGTLDFYFGVHEYEK